MLRSLPGVALRCRAPSLHPAIIFIPSGGSRLFGHAGVGLSISARDGEQALAYARTSRSACLTSSSSRTRCGSPPEEALDALPLVIDLTPPQVAQLGRAGRADAAQGAVDTVGAQLLVELHEARPVRGSPSRVFRELAAAWTRRVLGAGQDVEFCAMGLSFAAGRVRRLDGLGREDLLGDLAQRRVQVCRDLRRSAISFARGRRERARPPALSGGGSLLAGGASARPPRRRAASRPRARPRSWRGLSSSEVLLPESCGAKSVSRPAGVKFALSTRLPLPQRPARRHPIHPRTPRSFCPPAPRTTRLSY